MMWMQAALEPSWWRQTASQALQERKQHQQEARKWTLLEELKTCSRTRNLQRGREIHLEAVESGTCSCIYFATALVKMYAKCRSMAEARKVFETMKEPDVVSWTALISGYADNGEGVIALELFERMKSQRCEPNSVTFVAVLKACTCLALDEHGNGRAECLERGSEIHSQIGCHLDNYVQSSLISMYSKGGSMPTARQVFERMKHPDVVAWNTLISGYADNREGLTALDLFARMKFQGCAPNHLTFVAALKACTSIALDGTGSRAECLEWGKQLHSQAGCHSDMKLQNTLIDMYAKCGSMADARYVFDSMKRPDVISWTALILGYVDNGNSLVALDLFAKMKAQGYVPDIVTFVAALRACTSLALHQNERKAECLRQGKEIHSKIGAHSDRRLLNTLIDMYANCGSMLDARQVFDGMKHPDVVSWTALILGYADNGEGTIALDLFQRMGYQGCPPNSVTFVAALKACISLALDENESGRAECKEIGKEIHSQLGDHTNLFVQNTLIDMYGKCGSMGDAREVFDSMKQQDVVSWNTIILGYAENGEGVASLNLFAKMKSEGIAPNSLTFFAALKACGLLGALEQGTRIHAEIKSGTELDTVLVTCLVDFYAKCGDLVAAQKVFDLHPRARDLKTWTALLAGYAGIGEEEPVFGLVDEMQRAGLQPNGVTLLCVLMCCSHAGLVDKGKECLDAMVPTYGVTPAVEHYTCLIDVLGRWNKLDDAMALVQAMPCRPNVVTWITVLGACHKWKNAGIGTLAFECVVKFDYTNAAAYVLMAHIYKSRGMWREQQLLLETRLELRVS